MPAGWRRLPEGLLVGSGSLHTGPARVLVHRLKYQGVRQAAAVLATGMAEILDGIDGALVPVRRSLVRAWKYGIDPGRELCAALAALSGRSQADILRAPAWAPSHAGERRATRADSGFDSRPPPIGSLILVDDVITTGATLTAARRAVGQTAIYGVTATSAGRVVM